MLSHVAEVHRIRVFVVPDAALQGDPPLGANNPATPRHLDLAQNHVMRNAPDLVDDVQAIIVVGDKAATFLNRRLVRHEYAILEAAIRVFTESDVVEWVSEDAFTIVSTEKAERPIWYQPGTPENPFHAGPPFDSISGSDNRYRARSSTTRKEANGQQYKVSIRIGNRLIDPDYVCGNPPPP